MKRRSLLKFFFNLALGLGVAKNFHHLIAESTNNDITELKLVQKLLHPFEKDINSLKFVSQEYTQQLAQPVTRSQILAEISSLCPEGKKTLEKMTNNQYHDWLKTKIASDFAQGKVVNVKGWILSQTEIKLYSLALV